MQCRQFAPATAELKFSSVFTEDPKTSGTNTGIGRYSPLGLIERERHVLGEIAAGVPLDRVLEDLLLAVEAESGSGMITSVLFLSEDGQTMLHGAAPSLPDAYNSVVDGIRIGVGVGSCGTAAALMQPVYVANIATDPVWKDYRELALGFGLLACWSVPIKAADGTVLGTFAVYYGEPRAPTAEDINAISFIAQTAALAIERHRSDVKLQRRERELQALNADLERQVTERAAERDRAWKISRELLVVSDLNGRLEAVNPIWTETLGWTTSELIGRNFLDFTHPDDLMAAKTAIASVLRTPLIAPYEYRLRHKDGSYRWFAWTAALEADKVYASGRDVSHDHEREAILRDTQDFARLALSAVGGVGVWTYEVASDRFFYDGVIADLYGIDPGLGAGGILRVDFLVNVHSDDRAALKATMSGGLVTAGDLELEYRIRHPSGRVRWVLSRGHTYHDEHGTPVRRTGVGVETTNQRETEEALRQSQKMEAVGQLTGGVAHDFNNLLTVIRSSTDLLKRPNITEERRTKYVNAISDTVDRAAKLTGQLLAFARRQALKPKVFDVCESVRSVTDMLATLTGSRIEIATHLSAAACWINADPSQFDTALVNMAVNARDAMNDEGQLTIAVASVDEMPAVRSHEAVPGPFVAVSLADNGSGIAADRLEKIFEPFYTTKGVGQGTGLGLSQVFGFAKQSGGEVVVTSEVGRGTTFTIYLPRVPSLGQVELPVVDMQPMTDGHGTRVLVVEDNHDVGGFAIQALTELGYNTILATHADEALAKLADHADTIDVVFTDVVMPGSSGIELAKNIRARYPDIPVVLTSGYSHVLAQDGTFGFELLNKPYSIDELSRTLRRAASGRR